MTKRTLPPAASVTEPAADGMLCAPAASRNVDEIAKLLTRVAPPSGMALELASGTGQHIVQFAKHMPQLSWQPSDVAQDRLNSIAAYLASAELPNVLPPIKLDATETGWGQDHSADLIVLINLLHLISAPEAQALVSEVGKALTPQGCFVLYGPFMRDGELTSEGDRAFHASLTASDASIGYKNDTDIFGWLSGAGLTVAETAEMPANNLAMIARPG